MDDFDSFSTVVTQEAPQKDDFDSFSSVVDGPKPAKPKAKPKKGLIETGIDNLKAEIKTPLTAVKNLGLGVARGAADLVDGGMQIGLNNATAMLDMLPDNPISRGAKKVRAERDKLSQGIEDAYQEETKGSVLAGTGRVAGGMVVPGAGALGTAAKGATVLQKAKHGVKAGAALAALQPVYGDDAEEGSFAKAKAAQVAAGAALGGAAPIAVKGGLEVASKLGSKAAERSLTNTRKAQMFDKSPNAKADAEVITELGEVSDRIGDRNLVTLDINARSKKVTADAVTALKEAGGTKEELNALMNWQGLTTSEREALKASPQGAHIASIVEKMDRYRALTPGELSSRLMAPLRAALDVAPLPNLVRQVGRRVLGGTQARYETAEKFLDPRSQRAAREYLLQNGSSDGTKGIEALKAMKKSGTGNPGGISDYDLVQNAINKREAKELAELMKPRPATFSERAKKKQEDKQNQALADQISKDPSLLIAQARDPRQFKKTSAVLKADIEARMKQKADAEKARTAAQEAAEARKLEIKARKVSGTPGGGAYQALMEHTGLAKDDLNKALRVARRIPEAAKEVEKIRVNGENTKSGAIYPITDIVKAIADDMGMQRGALTQVSPIGVLSGETEKVSARYQMATKVRQGLYKEAQAKASSIGNVEARKAVVDLAGKLKSTPKSTEARNRMIDELEAKYPDAQGIFDEIRHF